MSASDDPHWSSNQSSFWQQSSCWDALCCTPCAIAHQYRFVTANSTGFYCSYCLLGTIGPLCMIAHIRRRTVTRFRIEEGCTCLKGFCCPLCSLCQTHTEINRREGSDTLQQYCCPPSDPTASTADARGQGKKNNTPLSEPLRQVK